MAFFMEVAEFLIVTHASSLTLSVIGVVKVCRQTDDFGNSFYGKS
jgi:hypothetical protein